MFTKRIRVGTAGSIKTAPVYRDVIDWPAVGGAIFVVLLALGAISSCTG